MNERIHHDIETLEISIKIKQSYWKNTILQDGFKGNLSEGIKLSTDQKNERVRNEVEDQEWDGSSSNNDKKRK
tara:strand:- start:666 stop:884 length:219 start_codon:yes stop_codon:yes gene_type:complete